MSSSTTTGDKPDKNETTTLTNTDTINTTTSNDELERAIVRALLTEGRQNNPAPSQRQGRKERYAFWGSQPVPQFSDVEGESDGPIDGGKTVDEIRPDPLKLPSEFEWCVCNVQTDEVAEEVYKLLKLNYVEDDDMMFRFDYSPGFLKWALLPPGFQLDWLVGVRVTATKKLVGFISAIPADIQVNSNQLRMVEINFLCVHKKLRSRRLAPVLIKEITRRVNLQNIWQATYTAGVVLPTPIAKARYWHRSLNPKKLIDVGFSRLANNMTMARTVKLYRLPSETRTKGFRELQRDDCAQVQSLLMEYLADFKVAPKLGLLDVEHWLLPRNGVVYSYVVENESGRITDLASFYALPSSVLRNPDHKTLNAAYMYYTVPGSTPLDELMKDALIMAKDNGFDVFNALDILQNQSFLKELKFGEGDGFLQYYLYNWRVKEKLTAKDVGLILL
eukprot:g4592.t1